MSAPAAKAPNASFTSAMNYYTSLQATVVPQNEGWLAWGQRWIVTGIATKVTWIARLNFLDATFGTALKLPKDVLTAAYNTVTIASRIFVKDSAHFAPGQRCCDSYKKLGYNVFGVVDSAVGVFSPALAWKLDQWRIQAINSIYSKCCSKKAPGNI